MSMSQTMFLNMMKLYIQVPPAPWFQVKRPSECWSSAPSAPYQVHPYGGSVRPRYVLESVTVLKPFSLPVRMSSAKFSHCVMSTFFAGGGACSARHRVDKAVGRVAIDEADAGSPCEHVVERCDLTGRRDRAGGLVDLSREAGNCSLQLSNGLS